MMVVLGTDAHKRSHTVVAVDEVGAEIGSITVAATTEGHLRLVKWAARFDQRRRRPPGACRGRRLVRLSGPPMNVSRRGNEHGAKNTPKPVAAASRKVPPPTPGPRSRSWKVRKPAQPATPTTTVPITTRITRTDRRGGRRVGAGSGSFIATDVSAEAGPRALVALEGG
jgi:hypothetical protein